MFTIRTAKPDEFGVIRNFYHTLTDEMEHFLYHPGWKKEVYPTDEYLRETIQSGTLFVGLLEDKCVAAMMLNHAHNPAYDQIEWQCSGTQQEVSVIHALGVLPAYHGKGLAKAMVGEGISIAKGAGQKAIRLDVLGGNMPAARLYEKMGFRYVDTLQMFYEDTGVTDYMLYEYQIKTESRPTLGP